MRYTIRRFLRGSAIAILVGLVAVAVFNIVRDERRPVIDPATQIPESSLPQATFSPQSVAPVPQLSAQPTEPASPKPLQTEPARPAGCERQARTAFTPRSMSIEGVTTSSSVIALGLDENDAPAAPSFSQTNTFAWYKLGPAPGSQAGNVLFNTHTFSHDEVLGNRMIKSLRKGDIVIVHGATDTQVLCYRITNAPSGQSSPLLVQPADYATLAAQFDGPSRALFTVCANKNQVTGVWEKRAVWFAVPVK